MSRSANQYAMLQRDGRFLVCCCGHQTFQLLQGPGGCVLAQCQRCDAIHHPVLMPTVRPPKCACFEDCEIVVSSIEVSGTPPEGCDE